MKADRGNPRKNGLPGLDSQNLVRKDWVVETEGTKLPTPLAVMSNQSLTTVPRTEFLDAAATRRNRPNSPQFQQPVIEPVRGIIAQLRTENVLRMCLKHNRKPALFQQRGSVRPLYLVLIGVYA